MSTTNKLIALSTSMMLLIGIAACGDHPAESAGKSVDQAINNTGKTVQTAVKEIGVQMDKANEILDDAAITLKIKNAILADTELEALQIHVDTLDGLTKLSGSVNSQKNRDKAGVIAAAVSGVTHVNNQLIVTTEKS